MAAPRVDEIRLERVVARQLASLLEGTASESGLSVDPASEICFALELYLPQVLRRAHPEWDRESIDGFFFFRTEKRDLASVELSGVCILITDQAMTPIRLDLDINAEGRLQPIRIRVGEAGGGPLGISGPAVGSSAADYFLPRLGARLDQIDWVYDVSVT